MISKPVRGVLIPGLGMAAHELPELDGFLRLENPEVGDGLRFSGGYGLEDVAQAHLARIQELELAESFQVIGMSMGGMIASILATKFRGLLPAQTRFRFLVTSPNLKELPAVSDELLGTWYQVRPGSIEGFTRIMEPFFSRGFREKEPAKARAYYEYRASGQNRQSAVAFIRQLSALRQFDGQAYFSKVDPAEATFIGGAEDYILGPKHNLALQRLCPGARHDEIVGLGHMINIERPELFE